MNKSLPKISIITPSFNQGQFIEKTILSVINQNYNNIEYIIIDGGSTDQTIEIIKKYEDKIHYWVSEPDNGQSDAINKGLKIATGDIINWLNSDDYLYQGALKKIANQFIKTEIHCVCGKTNVVDTTGNPLFSVLGSWVNKNDFKNTLQYLTIEQPATFFSREAVLKMGLLNQKLHFVMDKEWWLKFLIQFKLSNIKMINDYIVYFRSQPDSKTVSQSEMFSKDQATLYHSIAKQKKLDKEAKLLKAKFDVDEDYQFNEELVHLLDTDDFKLMLQFFMCKNFSLVFNKIDLINALEVKKIFPIVDESFDYNQRMYYNRLIKNTKVKSWFLFRILRKLKRLM